MSTLYPDTYLLTWRFTRGIGRSDLQRRTEHIEVPKVLFARQIAWASVLLPSPVACTVVVQLGLQVSLIFFYMGIGV